MKKLISLVVVIFVSASMWGQQENNRTVVSTTSTQTSTQYQYQSNNRNSYEEQDTARWKGSYIGFSLRGGIGGLGYTLRSLGEKGSQSDKLGYGFDFTYSYYFNNHWGISTGVSITRYKSIGKLNGGITDDKYYELGDLIDDDLESRPTEFELRTRVSNLHEKQTTYFLEVPLKGMYQTHFGEEENWGLYAGAGIILQFPFASKFKVLHGENSEFNVSGYYYDIPTDMGAPSNPPVPQHGYGTITDPNASLNWSQNAKLRLGVAVSGELGFFFKLSPKTDLLVGGYIDYGIKSVKKHGRQNLFTAPSKYHPGADNQIGTGIKYNGMLNSNVTGKVKPIAFGAKIGLRFQMGKNN